MRRLLAYLLIGGLVLGARGAAEAVPTGEAFALIDGQVFDLPAVQVGKIIRVRSEDGAVLVGDANVGQMRISATGNMDPSIAYSILATDTGAPSTFGFFFGIPIAPVGFPSVAAAGLLGTLTDATGDGVSIAPMLAAIQVTNLEAPTMNLGVDVGPAVAFGPGSPGASHGYGPFAAGPTAGPGPGPWTSLMTGVVFDLSGGGDDASLRGLVAVVSVPGPPALVLLACGLMGAGAASRRRRTHPS